MGMLRKTITILVGIGLLFYPMAISLGADTKAKRIRIDDGGGYYTGTEVETALQEIPDGTLVFDLINVDNLIIDNDSILADVGASGILILGGTGGANDENLWFDFESVADEINIYSTTGADVIDYPSSTWKAKIIGIEEAGLTPITQWTYFQGQAQASDITYTLPAALGAAGTVFTDAAGDGTLSWAVAAGGWDGQDDLAIANGVKLTGGYLHIGNAGTVNKMDGDGDLYVENELEVDSQAYFASNIVGPNDDTYLSLGTGSLDCGLSWYQGGNDYMSIWTKSGSTANSGFIIIADEDDKGKNWGNPALNHPCLRIQSKFLDSTDDFIQFWHNRVNANIEVGEGGLNIIGTGNLNLEPNTINLGTNVFDAVVYENNGVYTDHTAEAKSVGGTAFTIAEIAADDIFYIGSSIPIYRVYFDFDTISDGDITAFDVEFFRASSFSNVSGDVDGTSLFTQDGKYSWYTSPTLTWEADSIDDITGDATGLADQTNYYWVRFKWTGNASPAVTANSVTFSQLDNVTVTTLSTTDLNLKPEANTTIGDGGTTNYAQFASDGELTLVGTARVTKNLVIAMEGGQGAAAPTARTSEDPYLSWTFAINDDNEHTIEAPHDMDFTQDMAVYVVWYTSVDQTDDEVNWQLEWNSRATGETVNAGATTDTSGDIACPTQWVITETMVETIAGNSITADDVVGLDLKRIAIVDGTDPQVNTIHVLNIHAEYIANKIGEAT